MDNKIYTTFLVNFKYVISCNQLIEFVDKLNGSDLFFQKNMIIYYKLNEN